MKRIAFLLLGLILTVSLCACGEGKEPVTDTTEQETNAEAPVLDADNAVAITIEHIYDEVLANQARAMQNTYLVVNCSVGPISSEYFDCGNLLNLRVYLPTEELVKLNQGDEVAVLGKVTEINAEKDSVGSNIRIIFGDAILYTGEVPPIIQEEKYQEAVGLMAENRYKEAGELLNAILDYKDSESLYVECCVKTYAHSVPEYLEEKFSVLQGDAISTSIIGTWNVLGGDTWIFLDDGTLDKGASKVVGHAGERIICNWSVDGDMLVISNDYDTDKFVVKVPYDGAIILYYGESKTNYQGEELLGTAYTSMWKE